MVESSFGLVILLFVIFGIMEFGQLIMTLQILNNATRTAARVAAAGRQPATYLDGTATPSPGGVVDTPFLNTWITKALLTAPLKSVTPQYYGSNSDGTPNTSLAWTSTAFGQGFYINVTGTYVPLFSGTGFYANSSGVKGPIVGSIGLKSVVFVRSEANN